MADPKYVRDFIAEITPYAVAIGDQYGIDPVTIITQAAVETGWGREVAGNNYFGVKSHGQPGGQNVTTHEEVDGKRVRTTDNFRTYGSLGESVADYGRFLSENPRYAEALKLSGPGELQGIAAAGYATDSNYADLTRDVAGMVQRNIQPLPPGSLPEVGTLQDTRRTPSPVAPVTPTPDMSLMRSNAAPSQLIPDTFARLPKPSSANLGDNLAMSPVQGGAQQAPMFDAAFDTRLGAMRTLTSPIDSQGIAYGASKAPPPVPASVEDRVTARNTALPPIVRLPELPPSRLGQAPIPASVEDRVTARNRVPSPVGLPPSTRTVASVPMPARQSIPQSYAGMERAPSIPDRLTPGLPGMPALYGDFAPQQVAQIGVPAFPDPLQPRTRVASAAPFPMPRPSFMPQGVASRVAPVPLPRPNFGMGGPDIIPRRSAPVPMPRPVQQPQQRMNPVQLARSYGRSPQEAYEIANEAAAFNARSNASKPSPERSDYFKMATGG